MSAYSEIVDQANYNALMAKSLMDKLFFVDKIEPDVVFDFGCADGLLLEHIALWLPESRFVGYDNNESMIVTAKNRIPDNDRFLFFSNWEDVQKQIDVAHRNGEKAAIILSSIIHEVYHYQEPHEVDLFWKRIFDAFDYIVIRDMMPSRTIDRPSDISDVARVYHKFGNTPQLQDFQNAWGSIENNRNLTHFLLKYKYLSPNWDREVKENYMPLFREDLLSMIPPQYRVIYHEHYVLPYIRRTVRTDFDIELKDPTHLKLILERKS